MPLWPVRFDLRIDLNDVELHRLLVTAEALARAVNGIPVSPAVRKRLNHLNIVRAVRGTTGIEGARLTELEVERILTETSDRPVLPPARLREEQEARNAAEVMYFVAEQLTVDPTLRPTINLVRRLHELTTKGIDYQHNSPGHFRRHAVTAGDFVPPRTGDEVESLMEAFEVWLNRPPATHWPPVVRAVVAHFYFVSIHPFGDGNGRTARAIESFLLYQSRMNPLGFYSLANFYYRDRDEYIRMLNFTRFESGNDLAPFVKYCIGGLVQELEIVFDEVITEAKYTAFREVSREVIRSDRAIRGSSKERLERFLAFLGRDQVPIASIRDNSHPVGSIYRTMSWRTALRDMDSLEAIGLLVRNGDAVRARVEITTELDPGPRP